MGREKAPQNLLQGQAGVYRVASALCLQGLNPFFPAVDHGVDILVDGLIRVQVKSAHLRTNRPYPQGAYWFKLGRTAIRGRRQVWESVDFTDFCDFVVFWGIEQDRFWITPAAALTNHQCLVLGPDVWHRNIDVESVSGLLASGMLQSEVAGSIGVSQSTVSRHVRGIHAVSQRSLGATVKGYESRWDLIHEYLSSLRGVDATIGSEVLIGKMEK